MAIQAFVNRLYQFCYSRIPMLTYISGQATFGSSGAVSATSGSQILSVTKLATGIYRIKFQGNYNALINAAFTLVAPQTGNSVTAGSFATGTLYQITALGTTNFKLIGLPSDVTPAIGQTFCATGAGAGTGTAKAVGSTGVATCEIDPGFSTMTATTTPGSYMTMLTYDAAGALVSPASGSVIRFSVHARSSSVNQE